MESIKDAFSSAASFLPENVYNAVMKCAAEKRESAEEIRLRVGQRISLSHGFDEEIISSYIVKENDIARLVENVTGSSVHSYVDYIKCGFIPVRGGHRLGICGTCSVKDGQVGMIRNFSSANLRIARDIKGISAGITGKIACCGEVKNTLIISPPGIGKTTLLRDIIRNISYDCGVRVSVIDERGELAGSFLGRPQFDLGPRTDIMDGCPKAEGIEMMIRAMAPKVIAVDEITCEKDVRAVEKAVYCGVSLIATTHAENAEDFKNRPVYKALRKCGVFKTVVTIKINGGKREYAVSDFDEYLK